MGAGDPDGSHFRGSTQGLWLLMSSELIAIVIVVGFQTAGLIAAAVMIYRLGKLWAQLDTNDKVLSLQSRQIQDAIQKANALMREELLRK